MDKSKILIVDDEVGFAQMVQLNLEETEAYEVRIETDPRKALDAAKEFLPDLILLDVIMAKKEGPDVAIEIRSCEELKNVPIIFLTATVTRKELKSDSGVIGGQAFIAKPCNLEVLINAIEEYVLK